MPRELNAFVRDALAAGQSREAIRAALRAANWRAEEIDAALADWAEGDFPVPVPRRRPQLSARDAFLHLLMFATLYVATYSAGAAWFFAIERWIPDAAQPLWRGGDAAMTALRWAVAWLLIGLPVFVFTHRIIARGLAREPEQRSGGVRRWLTYLTLFVAALVLIGDFVAVLRGFLAGELVPRFLLKSLVVAVIAGVVFWHYLVDLRRDEVEGAAAAQPWLGRAGVAGLAATAVVALLLLGTPGRARTRELDLRRVEDVQAISASVELHRTSFGELPPSLAELGGRPVPGFEASRRDPVTGLPYPYERLDSLTYAIDAVFERADSLGPGGSVQEFWRHPAGAHRFTFRVPPHH